MRRLLISVLKGLNFIVRKISVFTYFVQLALQWGFHPRPEWFDHYFDRHWQFSAKNNGLWVDPDGLEAGRKDAGDLLRRRFQRASLLFVEGCVDHGD